MSSLQQTQDTITLDTFFENSFDTPIFYTLNTSNGDHKDMKTLIHDYEMLKQGRLEEDTIDVARSSGDVNSHDDNSELENVAKYTRLGANMLKECIEKYSQLCKEKQELQYKKDDIFKSRNKVIYELLKMFTDKYPDELSDITSKIESLVQRMNEGYSIEFKRLNKDIKKTKGILTQLSDVYCIHKNTKAYHVCPVCYDNQVEVYCNPCGHVFCKPCLKNELCPICRSHITNTGNLYF